MALNKQPEFICDLVERRWTYWYPKSPLRRILARFREKSASAIEIIQRSSIDLDTFDADGSIINYWEYDNEGWKVLNVEEEGEDLDESGAMVDYLLHEICQYYIDETSNVVRILWSRLRPWRHGIRAIIQPIAEECELVIKDGKHDLLVKNREKGQRRFLYLAE